MSGASFVLDNSVVMAWLLGEDDAAVDGLLDRLAEGEALVPAVWPLEFSNALVVAERRRRLSAAQAAEAQELILGLPLRVVPEPPARVVTVVYELAREHGLSVYDASYLDLALRERLPLATLDRRLAEAARRCGVAPA